MKTLHDLPQCFLHGWDQGEPAPLSAALGSASGWRCWLLTGGPLTAKSSLMKALAIRLTALEHPVTLVSDWLMPAKPAGLLAEDLKLLVLDGESVSARCSMIAGPGYPGLCTRLLDFGPYLREATLRRSLAALEAAGRVMETQLDRGALYLRAAAVLQEDNLRLSREALRREQTQRYARNLARRLIPKGPGAAERRLYLSGVTGVGPVFYRSTPGKLCRRVIPIADEFGAASALLLEILRQEALAAGQPVIFCPSPLLSEEKPEQLLLPAAGLAFVVTNRQMQVDSGERTIHARRFLDPVLLRSVRQKLLLNRRLSAQLLAGVGEHFALAAAEREKMAQCYDAALDPVAPAALLVRAEQMLTG